MRKHQELSLLLVGVLMIPAIAKSAGADLPAYAEMSGHYEAIRLSLLSDTAQGLSQNALAIRDQAAQLLADPPGVEVGVPEQDAGELDSVLEEIETAAEKLADAADLEAARAGFSALTKPLARYRKLAGDDQTIVAYCSMARKAWIQPSGEIGNPYMGQRMPRCGEVVGE